ncbi:MAG: hypothetical protein IT377_22665 [Polyangiaceae bacterium]|nr:hypothetical protein [Myxococcales bacterium]MCC6901790.1 hypothetical protein [Polyangiaceae bacterium]
MTPADREVASLLSDVLDLCLRRACADDNAADALALVRDAVARWAETGFNRQRVQSTLYAVLRALRATAMSAPAGTFERRYANLTVTDGARE